MIGFLARNKTALLLFGIWFLIGQFSVPVFYLIGIATIILLWRKQSYFELLIGFFFILILSDNLSAGTDFAKSFKNIYIVLLAAIAVLDRHNFQETGSIMKYFLPFIALSAISLAFSPYVFTGFQKMLSYLLILFVVPQFFMKSLQEKGPKMIKDMIFFGVTLILIGFLLRFMDPGVALSHGGRFRAVFGNPNGLGIFCTLLFALTLLARDYFGSFFSKADLRWIFIPIAATLLMTGSRTAVIAVVMLLVFARVYRLHPAIGFVAFLAFVLAAEVVSANLVQIVSGLGLSEFFRVETLADGSGRYVAWEFAWKAIQDNLWLGRGFAFDEWLMAKNEDLLSDLGHQGGVHNTYLIIWLNTGLIGLLLFLRGYILLFLKGSKNSGLAFPIFYMVAFSILLEPWLAASLNPFTILLLCMLTILTEPIFQNYAAAPVIPEELPDEEKVFA